MNVMTREAGGELGHSPMDWIARRGFLWMIALGVASIAVGIIVMAWPSQTLRVVGILFGIYLLIFGIIEIMIAFAPEVKTSARILNVLTGALSILLGLICFRGALESTLLLALWIGFGWLITGVARAVAAGSAPELPYRGWQIFGGILIAIAGIIVIVSPISSIFTLAILAGVWLVVLGVWQIFEAFVLQHRIRVLRHSGVAPTPA